MNTSKPTVKLRFHCEPSGGNPHYVTIETITVFNVRMDGSLEEIAAIHPNIQVHRLSLENVAGWIARSIADELDARVVSTNYVEEDNSNGAE